MPPAFAVHALDSVVCVEFDASVPDHEQERIRAQWVDLLAMPGERVDFTLRAGLVTDRVPTASAHHRDVLVESITALGDAITTQVTFVGAAGLQGQAIMLHSAGLSTESGEVLGLVGPSGRGKTTAARELGAGLFYVTDETLAIRPDGAVVPYPKPLSLGRRPGAKQPTAATSLGMTIAPEELSLSALVLLERREDVTQPYVERVTTADALVQLVQQASFLRDLPKPLLTLARLLVSTGGLRRVVYSEASTLDALVPELLESGPDHGEQFTHVDVDYDADCGCVMNRVPGQPTTSATPWEEAPAGTYRRATYDDALLVDEQLLILTDHAITSLDGLGPAVWLAADDASIDELTDAALAQMPPPPEGVDPRAVVAEVAAQLVDSGLLVAR